MRVYKDKIGWNKRSPKKGQERSILLAKCGEDCFLRPPDGFPICQRWDFSKRCVVDCRGLWAAFIRAQRLNYGPIAHQAVDIGNALGCEWSIGYESTVKGRKIVRKGL